MKRKTNFDQYLEEQLKDVVFAERFKKAGEAWDVALGLAALRGESYGASIRFVAAPGKEPLENKLYKW